MIIAYRIFTVRHIFCAALTILLYTVVISTPAYATDQALLVGIERYADPQIKLVPGAQNDLTMMRQLATDLGIRQITTLFNQQATTQALASNLAQFTSTTVPGDRILLYFSGHGTQIPDDNNDESDSLDEVWVLYNTRFAQGQTLRDPWRDDELAYAINKLPGREIMVIVDSCHSGSSSKDLNSTYSSRLLALPLPFDQRVVAGIVDDNAVATDHLLFTAGPSNEEVYGDATGGVFTNGLYRVWNQAQGSRTWAKLHQDLVTYLQSSVSATYLRIPQLQGPVAILNKPLESNPPLTPLTPTTVVSTATARLQTWVNQATQPLALNTLQLRYRFGELLRWETYLPQAGYVLVLAVGPDEQLDQIYPPIDGAATPQIAGAWAFPAPTAAMQLTAGPPVGENRVAIFFHSTPLSLAILQQTGVPAGTWAGITSVWVDE